MQDTFWHELFDEFVSQPQFTEAGYKFRMALNAYQEHLTALSNQFINECREIHDAFGPYDLKLKLTKLKHIFRTTFDVDFERERPFNFRFFKGQRIIDSNGNENELAIVARAHFESLLFCIDVLQEILLEHKKQQRSHVKISGNPFRLSLTAGQLQQIHGTAIRFEFIDGSCKLKTFIDFFNRINKPEKLNWTGTVYSLNYFIKELYQENNKLPNGFWEAVSSSFTVSGNQISPLSLRHPGKGKNDQIEKLNTLIDHFRNPD